MTRLIAITLATTALFLGKLRVLRIILGLAYPSENGSLKGRICALMELIRRVDAYNKMHFHWVIGNDNPTPEPG